VTLVSGTGTSKHLQISAVVTDPTSKFVFSDALAASLKLDTPDSAEQMQYQLGSASDGAAIDAGGLIGDPGQKTGLYALDGIAFNLLCLPDVMNLDDGPAAAVISAAETFCAPRWAFLLVDVPQGGAGHSKRDTLVGIQDWLAQNGTLRSSYAALYFPRPQIPDPLNGYRLRSVGPSGTIAGLYAQTDGTRGVWKAPAGTAATLINVPALDYLVTPGGPQVVMTDAENGALNPLGINCLRSLPVYGNVCWGARTLDGADQIASQWKYVPVRRLALYIEASLYRGTQWVVFEPNDEPLWAQIRLNVGSFMRGLFQQGAFQGSTPSTAYFVKCDTTTTTQTDINNGVVNIVVGFAPLLPAEFVVLQIQQIAGQIPT
jgi:phage tail sheath protein FI